MPCLTKLSLSENFLGRQLDLEGDVYVKRPRGILGLKDAPFVPHLEYLDLSGNHLSHRGYIALLSDLSLPCLKTLDLQDNKLSEESAKESLNSFRQRWPAVNVRVPKSASRYADDDWDCVFCRIHDWGCQCGTDINTEEFYQENGC